MARPGRKPKKQKKDGFREQHRMAEIVRAKQILGDAHELIVNCTSVAQLRKILNSASWTIKKAILLEALELGHIDRANHLATQILQLTETKKQEIRGEIGYNAKLEVLLAEVTGVPFEVLAERAKQIKSATKQITEGDGGRARASSDRGGDETPESFEVLVVEDGSVQEQSLPIRNRNVRGRANPSASRSSGSDSE